MRLSGNGRSGSTRGSGAGNVRRCTGWGASPAAIPTCSSCGGRACGRRLECRSRMRRESHVRFWEGGGVQVPSATRLICHCRSEEEARTLWNALEVRFRTCGLVLHPTKTKLVYCKDTNRRGDYPVQSFDFLGYTFRPRKAAWRGGRYGTSFLPAASPDALKAIWQTIRRWAFHHRTDKSLADLARMYRPYIQGWINYYSHFYKSELTPSVEHRRHKGLVWGH